MQVFSAFKCIKSKAQGSDGIPLDFIKSLLPLILPYLTNIFNSSLSQDHFPIQWKSALVKPIPKKGNAQDQLTFRPISFLSVISKALEKLVHEQITAFLKQNKKLNDYQSGFRHGHSTTTALVKITDDMRRSMDKKEITTLVLLDFSKAFDSLDKDILAAKIHCMGFSPSVVKWITSYLSDRKQKVIANNMESSWVHLTRGAPQGSMLGPLLFFLYINDCSSGLNFKYHLYADDLQICLHSTVKNLSNSLMSINGD